MTSIWTRRKRNSECPTTRVKAKNQKKQVKVRTSPLVLLPSIHISVDLPLRTPSKKHDEESVASSHKRDSPVLKKAVPSLQQRSVSAYPVSSCIGADFHCRAVNSSRRYRDYLLHRGVSNLRSKLLNHHHMQISRSNQ